MVMDGLALASGAPIPATNAQAFLFLGMIFLVGAAYAWTQRDDFARRRREGFEKLGWYWAARLVPDDRRTRRIGVFFAVTWGALGVLALAAGVVFAFLGI
ncbi:hypothetical protein GCM10009655_14680 [Rhodoglobus aureus]|uniref:Uncharacterized protein n=1 Tax=Rhodoglobus aureus TaxID=191497 RepID=A0ABN1VND3_9MICO